MGQLLRWFRSLGVQGAVDNARVVVEERRRDDWVLASLALRVERIDAAGAPVTAATAATGS